MFSFLSGLNIKIYIGIALIIFAIGGWLYVSNLKSDLETTKIERDEANKNNELIIKAYELTLAIEKEKNTFEAITQKEKEPLVKISEKVKQEIQNVKKYKETKQDEKECPKLGTFKL